MATDVPMPKLGLTMEEATIIEWLVDEGAEVAADEPIVLIETDKTETEVGSPGAGRLHQIGRPGDVFPCGERIGLLLEDGEAPPASTTLASPATAPSTSALPPPQVSNEQRRAAPVVQVAPVASAPGDGGRLLASPNARRVAAELGVDITAIRGTGPGGRIVSEDVEAAADSAPTTPAAAGRRPPTAGTTVATVAARNLADLLGVDLATIAPDPVDGRVTRDGVARHVRRLLAAGAPRPEAAPTVAPLLQEPSETIRLSGMRGTIAKRMQASLREMAQLTLTMDAEMTAVLADRAARRAEHGSAPTITDYVVAAAARALVRHPRLNSQVTEAGIAVLPEVHVGLAVAVTDGLLVPVVRDTAHRGLDDLSAETARLAAAARSGSLTPADLEGGTFSVSALGAFGVDSFTPVINPPNAAILGVGRLRQDVVLVDGAVTAVDRLTLSLTWDHRVVDGAPAAEFCRTVVGILADPAQLA